jgi:hypothetical protein
MPPFSRTPIVPSRSRTEARPSDSDRFARRPLRNKLPLPQQADNTITRNEWDGHGEAEATLVDPDWIMRSPSPVELYAPPCFAFLWLVYMGTSQRVSVFNLALSFMHTSLLQHPWSFPLC